MGIFYSVFIARNSWAVHNALSCLSVCWSVIICIALHTTPNPSGIFSISAYMSWIHCCHYGQNSTFKRMGYCQKKMILANLTYTLYIPDFHTLQLKDLIKINSFQRWWLLHHLEGASYACSEYLQYISYQGRILVSLAGNNIFACIHRS